MTSSQHFFTHRLANGLMLLGEPMDAVSSAAFSLLVPYGTAIDPDGGEGTANVLTEMFVKGAGPWDSKELSEQFEEIGLQRSQSAGIEVAIFSGTLLGENLERALEITSTMILKPWLPEEELGSIQDLALQDLRAIEDEPSSKVMEVLAKEFYPHPFGRSQIGTENGIRELTIEKLKAFYAQAMVPDGSILAVAGKFDWEKVKAAVEDYFGGWSGTSERLSVPGFSTAPKVVHLERDTQQLQIALAYPSVSMEHPDYYAGRVGINVLAGGMAGRLFVEVREKRGLVYRVSASHSSLRGRSAVFASAGTTPDNGEECLQVMLKELRGLTEGVPEEELDRAKADLKSRLIMQSESSSSRASGLVNDWWSLGRLRKLDEVKQAINTVSSEDIVRFSNNFPAGPITLVTLGSKRLELN